jgi:hypothetical protein
MVKFRAYDYRQRVCLPVPKEDRLRPGTLVLARHTLVETRLDTAGFARGIAMMRPGATRTTPSPS